MNFFYFDQVTFNKYTCIFFFFFFHFFHGLIFILNVLCRYMSPPHMGVVVVFNKYINVLTVVSIGYERLAQGLHRCPRLSLNQSLPWFWHGRLKSRHLYQVIYVTCPHIRFLPFFCSVLFCTVAHQI